MIDKEAPTDARITGPNEQEKKAHEKKVIVQQQLLSANCAAIPSGLIERELFVDTVKGAAYISHKRCEQW
jgi:transcriptional regulator with GAF, ATPase, and Fis domain